MKEIPSFVITSTVPEITFQKFGLRSRGLLRSSPAASAHSDLSPAALFRSALEEFRTTRWLRSSIEREFIIIGEALRNAIAADPALAAQITDARSIIGFRNIVVHGYSTVDRDFVWGFIETDLPRLVSEVRQYLKES